VQLRFAGKSEWRPAAPAPDAPGVHIWHTQGGAVIAYGFEQHGWYWMDWPSLATFRFSADEPSITAFAEARVPHDLITDVYRRGVLPMALQALGHEALHASAVLTEGGVIAFAAASQTGKSTVAFGLSRRGYQQWADDGVAFKISGGQALAVPLPFDVRLRPESSGMFGLDGTKFHQFGPEGPGGPSHLKPTPIVAICLLNTSAAESSGVPVTIDRLPPADAFSPVLVHAHEFNPFDEERRRRMLQAYLDLVAIVPVFAVRFQRGPDRFSHLLDAVIAIVGLGRPAGQRVTVA
jgi:hypothetical protein